MGHTSSVALTKYLKTLQANHMLQATVATAAATVWGHKWQEWQPERYPWRILYMTFKLRAWVLSHFSRVRLFATLWTVAHQAALSMGLPRQEYWCGLPCPPPGSSSWPKDQTHISYVSCTGTRILCYCHRLGNLTSSLITYNYREIIHVNIISYIQNSYFSILQALNISIFS